MERKKKKAKEYDKQKFLYFDFQNPDDKFVYSLLQKATKRNIKLIAIMAKEFMENFGIDENILKEDLIQIIDTYDIVKNIKTKQIFAPSPVIGNHMLSNSFSHEGSMANMAVEHLPETEKEMSASEIEENQGDFDMDDLEYALSGFGIE